MKNISGVYTITCKVDNKNYIGISINCINRFRKHKNMLKNNIHDNTHLQNAWNAYGSDNFSFEILEEYDPEFLFSMENWWCNMLQAHNQKFGYNISPTSPYGNISVSKETKLKISISNHGRIRSAETKEKLRIINTGKRHTEDSLRYMRETNHNNIKIDCYDLDGKFRSTHNSIKDAGRCMNISPPAISKCISGEYNLVNKFIFKFHNEILTKDEIKYRNDNSLNSTKRSVVGFYLTGEIIGIFDSFYQASKETNLNSYSISKCCKGIQKRVKNTNWSFY